MHLSRLDSSLVSNYQRLTSQLQSRVTYLRKKNMVVGPAPIPSPQTDWTKIRALLAKRQLEWWKMLIWAIFFSTIEGHLK